MEIESSGSHKWVIIISCIFILVGLYLTTLYNYLLFHSIAEMFIIVVACGIFILAWNSRRFLDNNYLLFIGVAYLFIAILELIHTLSYAGMGIFKGYGANLPTQLWIATRYMESFSLLIAPLFFGRKLKLNILFIAYTMVTCLIFLTVFLWNIFPVCFVEETGLTPFKKISEYVISIIFIGSIALLYLKQKEFEVDVYRFLIASILFSIAAELTFTFYIHVYGLSNLIGHYLTIISFFCVYKAIVETGLVKPHTLLYRKLKKSEENFRLSETRYRELFDNIGNGVAIYEVRDNGNDFIFKDFNKAGERLDGNNRESLIGKSIYEVRPGIEEFGLLDVFRRVFKTGVPEHFPAMEYKDECLQKWYENFVYRLPVGEIVAVFDDITEQKRTEEVLRESEEKYRNILESIEDGYFEVDNAGNFTFFNDSLSKILGYSKDELMGMNNRQYTDEENAKKLYKTFNKVYTTGKPEKGFDWEIIRKDGGRRHVEASVSLRKDFEGQPTGFRGIVRDVTERKRVEKILENEKEKFRVLVEESPLGVALISKDGRYKYLNPRFTEMFGYTLEDIPTGREWFKKAYPAQQYRHEVISVWINDQKEFGVGEARPRTYNVTSKDGSEKIIDFRPVTMETGDQFVICEDITDRTHAENERERLINELQNALTKVKTLSGLLPICAHCKKIRDDKGYWNQIESYIHKHSGTEFSHGICPECAKKYYPDMDIYDDNGEVAED